jgi:hypothetical protein
MYTHKCIYTLIHLYTSVHVISLVFAHINISEIIHEVLCVHILMIILYVYINTSYVTYTYVQILRTLLSIMCMYAYIP